MFAIPELLDREVPHEPRVRAVAFPHKNSLFPGRVQPVTVSHADNLTAGTDTCVHPATIALVYVFR